MKNQFLYSEVSKSELNTIEGGNLIIAFGALSVSAACAAILLGPIAAAAYIGWNAYD